MSQKGSPSIRVSHRCLTLRSHEQCVHRTVQGRSCHHRTCPYRNEVNIQTSLNRSLCHKPIVQYNQNAHPSPFAIYTHGKTHTTKKCGNKINQVSLVITPHKRRVRSVWPIEFTPCCATCFFTVPFPNTPCHCNTITADFL